MLGFLHRNADEENIFPIKKPFFYNFIYPFTLHPDRPQRNPIRVPTINTTKMIAIKQEHGELYSFSVCFMIIQIEIPQMNPITNTAKAITIKVA